MPENEQPVARIDASLEKIGLRLVCPVCKQELERAAEAYRCPPCRRVYSVITGVPDFRIFADRFISVENDIAKGLRALEIAGGGGFARALDAYWSITPELAPNLAARHKAHQFREAELGNCTLDEIERLCGNGESGWLAAQTLLDLGCQTAGFLVPAAARCRAAVGVDIAFRWLLLARLRLRERGLSAPLICASAEFLPFAEGSFGLVNVSDLVEHVADPGPVFRETARVLRAGGAAYFATNNRYSLLLEPHVRLWGVGWLPRRWQLRYVRRFRRHTYEHVRLLSGEDLVQLARQAGLQAEQLSAAPQPATVLPPLARAAVGAYERVRQFPLLAKYLAHVAPRIQLPVRKQGAH